MAKKGKSLLDVMEVKDTTGFMTHKELSHELSIISSCPWCGSPIYGPHGVKVGEPANVQFSCDCRNKG